MRQDLKLSLRVNIISVSFAYRYADTHHHSEAEDGKIYIEAAFQNENIWLTAKQMSQLFGIDVTGIRRHLKNIFESGELDAESVIKDFLITASDGKNYRTMHYNLDMVISVGYRIKSKVATRFSIWATAEGKGSHRRRDTPHAPQRSHSEAFNDTCEASRVLTPKQKKNAIDSR